MSELILYGYYRSSCSGRLRIALNIKDIPYDSIFVNIKENQHQYSEYAAINPSKSVPALLINGPRKWTITQSTAALEYLEDAYPGKQACLPVPNDILGRAQVRTMANIISHDVQPVTNMKILKRAATLGADAAHWALEYMASGFAAYESITKDLAGKYSYCDEISIADICLAPALWNAERFGLDLGAYPTICRIYKNLQQHPAFQKAHWRVQPDCPEDLR